MSSPESPQPESLPELLLRYDDAYAEVPASEQAVVAERFDALVDDRLAVFAADIKTFSFGRPQESLHLRWPASGSDYWKILIDRYGPPGANPPLSPVGQTMKEITLQRKVAGKGRDMFSYRLASDGVVYRWNGGDAYAKVEEGRIPIDLIIPDLMAPGETDAQLAGIGDYVREEMHNVQLEQQMGLNLRPIGLGQMEKLAAFVTQPDVVVAERGI